MGSLSSLGVGLTLVSSFLFLALMAELYYLFWWKRRRSNRDAEDTHATSAEALLHLCFWKKPSSLSSTALNPQEIHLPSEHHSNEAQLHLALKSYGGGAGEESVEAELMRLHSLAGPPRFLFTIKEETKEDLESEDGRSRGGGGRSRKGSTGKSLSELFLHSAETPFLTPLSSPPFFTPPLTPLESYKHHGLNPLFDSASPPPKFQFLKDAEEKLYRRTLMEQALKHQEASSVVSLSPPPLGREEEDASFITIVIGKNRERAHQHHHSSSSQVLPLPSSPSKIRATTHMGKSSISHTSSKD